MLPSGGGKIADKVITEAYKTPRWVVCAASDWINHAPLISLGFCERVNKILKG